MKKNFIFLLGGVLVLGLILYFVSPISHSDDASAPVVEAQPVEPEPEPVVAAPAPAPLPTPVPTAPPAPAEPSGPSPEVMQAFAHNLRNLGTCLETTNDVPGEELEPNLQTVVDSVRGEWGESVISTEDWMQVEMETPDGEKRRLRVEMDFNSDSQVQRKLKYMSVDPSGQTTPLPLAEDQAVEPSETLIASLESGNRVITRERFERIYFQNGEEIVARQSNGLIVDLEVNRGPKTYKCTKLNEPGASCNCIQ